VDDVALLDDQTQPPSQPNPPAAVVATNLITDLSLSTYTEQGGSGPVAAVGFYLSNSMIFAPMYFNLLGCMCGPATTDGVTPNPGGQATVTVTWEDAVTPPSLLATSVVDLTNATPGQMVWANNVVPSFVIGDAGNNGAIFYIISVQFDNPNYVFYGSRPCSVRNGLDWSAGGSWGPPGGRTQQIGVDLNLVTFDELSGNLFPAVTLNSILLRRGELRPQTLQPQVKISGAPRIAGTLGGSLVLNRGDVILANPGGLSGGPLWKPANLCTG
jgi:hypothetical protein